MTEHAFQTEVQSLLQLMIHSLYSEREIFLRELVSNANDACDKLRFLSLTDSDLVKGDSDFRIRIELDKDAKTLTIEDNGIGLTEAEAIEHLGTIAKSGTKAFLQQVEEGKAGDVAGLIGQFGVGFYASFMVADEVVVESRSATVSSDEGVRWTSKGDGNFATETIARPQRGTTITLTLKDDADEFADGWRVRTLIKKYSDYVAYPVEMIKEAEPAVDASDDDERKLRTTTSKKPRLSFGSKSTAPPCGRAASPTSPTNNTKIFIKPPANNGTIRRRACTSPSKARYRSRPCSTPSTRPDGSLRSPIPRLIALRAPRLHHGRLPRPAARIPALRARCGR